VDDAALDAAGADGAPALDAENVLDGHEEGLVDLARRLREVVVNGLQQLVNARGVRAVLPLRLHGLQGAAPDDGHVVAGELVVAQQFAQLKLHQVEQFLLVHHVHLVEEDDHRRHADLPRQEHVLLGLLHGAVLGGDDGRW